MVFFGCRPLLAKRNRLAKKVLTQSGSAKHRSGFTLCGILLHHILPALVLLRKPLFGLAKRQLPRTICAMAHNRENNLNHWKNKYR
jgi:hypothetical protein